MTGSSGLGGSGPGLPLLVGLIFTLSGCSPERPDGRDVSSAIDRRWIVQSSLEGDTLLSIPAQVTQWGDRLAVLDLAPPHLRVFDRNGRQLWTAGTSGEGPGEFGNPYRIVAVDSQRLFVLDVQNARVTEIYSDRSVGRMMALPGQAIGVDFFVDGDTLVIASSGEPPGTAFVDFAGRADHRIESWQWADTLPPRTSLHRFIAKTPSGWVTAPKAGPGFFLHSHQEERFMEYIEPRPLVVGRVAEMHLSAGALMVEGDSIFVLYGGRRAPAPRQWPQLIDVYDLNGEYLKTYELPHPVMDVARFEGRFIAIVHEPTPGIVEFAPVG